MTLRTPTFIALKPLAVLVITLALSFSSTARAQEDCSPSRLVVVLDKSSSMNNELGNSIKWDIAAAALTEVATAYDDKIQIGLDVFPAAGQCSPGEVIVEPAFGSAAAITAALAEPPPSGGSYTPMAESLDAVALHPSLTDPSVAPYVVLITDGWQYCVPYDETTRFAPVDAVARLTAAGITTFVVGFGDGVDVETLNGMATMAGTDRSGCDATSTDAAGDDNCYFQADSPAELVAALMNVAQEIPQGELCDGVDNDCDGEVDEALITDCSNSCGSGTSICALGVWEECNAPTPEAEICDGIDNDCDGQADEIEADDGFGLCGPTAYCDRECIDLEGEAAPAGCGCATTGVGGLAGGLIPLLLGFVLLARRRRRS